MRLGIAATAIFYFNLLSSSSSISVEGNMKKVEKKEPMFTVPLQKFSTTDQARRLSPRGSTNLYEGKGTHYIDLWIGSPKPQKQTVIVDTGSHVTAFPCKGCEDCGIPDNHIDGAYDFETSETFQLRHCDDDGKGCLAGTCKKERNMLADSKTSALISASSQLSQEREENVCSVSMFYAELSGYQGYEVVDKVNYMTQSTPGDKIATKDMPETDRATLSDDSFDLSFGCQTSLSGLFESQMADGIMGMSDHKAAIWRQMYDQDAITKKVFSICYFMNESYDKNETEAGMMNIGGFDERLWKTPIVYAQRKTNQDRADFRSFYEVTLRSVYLWNGGAEATGDGILGIKKSKDSIVKLNPEGTTDLSSLSAIVDSGSTDTTIPGAMGPDFTKVWKEMTGREFTSMEEELTEEQILNFPTMILQFHGVDNEHLDSESTVGLAGILDKDHPHDILVAVPAINHYEKKNSGLYKNYLRIHSNTAMIGASTMRNHDVVFDVDNSRIGFAKSDCNSNHLVEASEGGDNKDKAMISQETMLETKEVKDAAVLSELMKTLPQYFSVEEEDSGNKRKMLRH